MNKLTVSPKLYFYHEGKTTLNNIMDYCDPRIPRVYEEAERAGLEAIGPMEFIYFGASNDLDKEFTLRIALPVKEKKPVGGNYHFAESKGFSCVSTLHKGSIINIMGTYDRLFGEIMGAGLKPNDEIREVYHRWEQPESPTNETEIQIGIA